VLLKRQQHGQIHHWSRKHGDEMASLRCWWELHWLPVRRRVDFKLAVLVYKCLHVLAPTYLSKECPLVASDSFRRRLRSAEVDSWDSARRSQFHRRRSTRHGFGIVVYQPALRRSGTKLVDFKRLENSLVYGCWIGSASLTAFIERLVYIVTW